MDLGYLSDPGFNPDSLWYLFYTQWHISLIVMIGVVIIEMMIAFLVMILLHCKYSPQSLWYRFCTQWWYISIAFLWQYLSDSDSLDNNWDDSIHSDDDSIELQRKSAIIVMSFLHSTVYLTVMLFLVKIYMVIAFLVMILLHGKV